MVLDDKFYKSTEVADLLGVSLRTLYRYMDSDKIQSVQLPSGRHRFTKKQIEDFLYQNNISAGVIPDKPNDINVAVGYNQQQSAPNNSTQPAPATLTPDVNTPNSSGNSEVNFNASNFGTNENFANTAQYAVSQAPVTVSSYDPDTELEKELDELLKSLEDDKEISDTEDVVANVTQETTEQNEFDKLSKSLEDLSNNIAPAPDDVEKTAAPMQEADLVQTPVNGSLITPFNEPKDATISSVNTEADNLVSGISSEPTEAPVATFTEDQMMYFYCPYNDLRTVAKIIKKVGEDNNKEYAFTLNAGLSLFFPLDPFSVIHFYIKGEELDIWKENLQLKDSSKDEANVCVLLTHGQAFEDSKEVSGLKVVSKKKIVENLNNQGMTRLAEEAEAKLD